jgi:hypothetical protein
MPPQHERDPHVSREVFEMFATNATKMLDGHEEDSRDHEKRIITLETEAKRQKSNWSFVGGIIGGIITAAIAEWVKSMIHH